MKYYAAYGANLNQKKFKKLCKDSKVIAQTFLRGYKIAFRAMPNDKAYATIVKGKKTDFVPIGVYSVSDEDIVFLDKYEMVDEKIYKKEKFELNMDGKKSDIFAYVMNKKSVLQLPSKSYLDTIKQGYADFGFDLNTIDNAIIDVKSDGFVIMD